MGQAKEKIKLGISSCLLGECVRHDGGHKRHAYSVNTLSEFFEFEPFCPEVAAGLGTPRPTIHLKNKGREVRVVAVKDEGVDLTDKLLQTSALIVEQAAGLAGYILKKDSPSCGMERVRVYDHNNFPHRVGQGIFAETLIKAYPQLPVEEEGRLMDPVLRENFVERVYVYHRWLALTRSEMTVNKLIQFHTQHKFTLLAHNEAVYRQLGKLVADSGNRNIDGVSADYIAQLMAALKNPATRKRHTNVLMHASGYLKTALSHDEKNELGEVLNKYRSGIVPLIVPLTLLKHHFRRAPNPYIQMQRYIDPYPEELMLRNNL
ncbi:MAG: YbgA family protein [Thiotrichales bacterium]